MKINPLTLRKEQEQRPRGRNRSCTTGQVLVEALVAVSILTVGLLGILTLFARSLSLNRVISDNYTATYLAAEGIEVVKNLIDVNRIQGRAWNANFSDGDFEVEYSTSALPLSSNQDRFLRYDPSTHHYSYSGSTQTNFRRSVSIALVGSEELKVNSTVDWTTRGGGSFTINLEDHFYNWRP